MRPCAPDLPAIVGVPVEAATLGRLFPIPTANLLGDSERDDQATRTETTRYAATADALGLADAPARSPSPTRQQSISWGASFRRLSTIRMVACP
jgi:hypothetical protein